MPPPRQPPPSPPKRVEIDLARVTAMLWVERFCALDPWTRLAR